MQNHRRAKRAPSACANDNGSMSEEDLLRRWDPDIQRAAKAAARRVHHVMADDLAQEARLSLVLAARAGHWAEPYLRCVVRNAILNGCRAPKAVLGGVPLEDALPPAAYVDGDLFAAEGVERWVAGQPGHLPAVFELLYRGGLSQREAAERLGLSQPRVAQLHRALLERGAAGLRHLAA